VNHPADALERLEAILKLDPAVRQLAGVEQLCAEAIAEIKRQRMSWQPIVT
jgi:hypothetical protein